MSSQQRTGDIYIARTAIDQAFELLNGGDHEDECIRESFLILQSVRVRLDNSNAAKRTGKEATMKLREAEKIKRWKQELTSLEAEYVALARANLKSINGTQKHFERLETVVAKMRRIRNKPGIDLPTQGNAFLNQLLYPEYLGVVWRLSLRKGPSTQARGLPSALRLELASIEAGEHLPFYEPAG